HLEQLSRLPPNLLPMTKMAGIMINRAEWHGMLQLDRTQIDEKLADVAHLGGQLLGVLQGAFVVDGMTVFLEHGATAGRVDNHGINRVCRTAEGMNIRPGEFLSGVGPSGMIMKRSAANLTARNPYLTAVLLQNPRCVQRGFGEKDVTSAANEQGHSSSPL